MSREDDDEDLAPVFIPALVALLIHAEEQIGAPLTRNQVLAIRDDANCMMLPPAAKVAMDQKRGYVDIDPEQCWEQWSNVRAQLAAG
jgi:hypothetical protein